MKRICHCELCEEMCLIEWPPVRYEDGSLSCCELCTGGEEFNEENVKKAFEFLNDKIQEMIFEQ